MTAIKRTEDLDLASLMTVDEVIQRFPLFRRTELLLAMRNGELRHWRKGKGRLVTEDWLKDYVRRQLRGGDSSTWEDGRRTSPDDSKSEASGSDETNRTTVGTATGMTPEQDEVAAGLLAQAISKRPKKSSPRSH